LKRIDLSHGSGGEKANRLIADLFLREFHNETLAELEDGATLGRLVFTTDSFTVRPLFFPGGDIGKLAVAGCCNDLAVCGARPEHLSCAFIIEEGFALDDLKTIVHSMKEELLINEANIVTGDTKVVPRSHADGLFIAVSGIGTLTGESPGTHRLSEGDELIVSGPVGDHGAVILMEQSMSEFKSSLSSDCRSLWPAIRSLLAANLDIHAMRDLTRGGLSGILNEWALASGRTVTVNEQAIPIRDEVRAFCDIYGTEPYHLACEGNFIAAVAAADRERACDILRNCGFSPAHIGTVGQKSQGAFRVFLKTPGGSERVFDPPSGEIFPRIC